MAHDDLPITALGRDRLIAELERLREENARLQEENDMLARAGRELEELRALAPVLRGAQLRQDERPHDPQHRHDQAGAILGEAADVANMVMMVADLCARGMRL